MAGRNYDTIVAGVGGMGSAAAYELARRGHKVLGLEQFPLVHDRGSSHGQTRIIRKAYFEHPNYVPLAQRSFERWYNLEQATGRHLLTECGCLNIGKDGSELIAGVRRAAQEHRLPVEHLNGTDLRKRFGQLRFDDSYVAVLEKEAGFLYVEDCVRAHIEQARHIGADIHEQEPIVSWKADESHVEVQTQRGSYRAERLIVTAGAWAQSMLAELGLPLTVRRKVLLWFGTHGDQAFRRDVFPIYLTNALGGFYYGFPVIDGLGHKAARHDLGETLTDPAQVERGLRADDEQDVRRFLTEHLPDANGPLRSHKVCLYTLTPDEHFIIDVHPQHPRVVLAAGFSGHGFKFAPVVGEILADLAETGRTGWAIDMFQLRRFGDSRRAARN
jgi:sarcosine oxidase